ncbi:MAG: (d)CMP kinase [Bacteroidota bacterium]|nr:(d)CMP kinase [Bacteroidota bacterium]
MEIPINIAIDGHSSCGKSTIAKEIADTYKMNYVDTGAMYRAITLSCIQNNIIVNGNIDEKLVKRHINIIDIRFNYDIKKKASETLLNNINVNDKIRDHLVSENVSIISKLGYVRHKLIAIQREIAQHKNVVMDGRDIGTKVLPDAEIKLFITADIQERAKRRFNEQLKQSNSITFDDVYQNLINRDKEDSQRKINPLKKAKNAILIDTTIMSKKSQKALVLQIINQVIKKNI